MFDLKVNSFVNISYYTSIDDYYKVHIFQKLISFCS